MSQITPRKRAARVQTLRKLFFLSDCLNQGTRSADATLARNLNLHRATIRAYRAAAENQPNARHQIPLHGRTLAAIRNEIRRIQPIVDNLRGAGEHTRPMSHQPASTRVRCRTSRSAHVTTNTTHSGYVVRVKAVIDTFSTAQLVEVQRHVTEKLLEGTVN